MKKELPRIIIIDDEKDLCFLLASFLKSHGFNVQTYGTLQTGLEAVRSLKPDWVVLDNNLPDGLGWEKIPDIKAMAPGVHILNISADPDPHKESSDKSIFYMIKPLKSNAILDLIRGTH